MHGSIALSPFIQENTWFHGFVIISTVKCVRRRHQEARIQALPGGPTKMTRLVKSEHHAAGIDAFSPDEQPQKTYTSKVEKTEKLTSASEKTYPSAAIRALETARAKKGCATHGTNRVFCKVEHHAAEIDASRSDSYGKTRMFCKKTSYNANTIFNKQLWNTTCFAV